VDFEELWAINPDVVAWLYIPGANISMPILQHPTDNSYYLTHDAQKQSSSAGAIFIEDYNAADFTDMCTVVYGHRMYSGEMFGTLQATYSDETSFAESQYIAIYLPDREIVYQVFGAVPYDNSHILYYHDFDDQLSYRKFINTIYSTTGIDATLVEDLKPQYGDKLLILSTCLWGDKNNRYLVLAKELTE
jgi:sortase B